MKITKKSIIVSVIALAAFLAISFAPPFGETMNGDSMRVLGVLVGCIIMWAGNVVHECAVVLLMSALMAGIGHVPVETVFSAFNGSILWVLIAAFVLGAAMKRCGLLRRVALLLLKVFPKNFAGTSVGLMVVGTVIAPFLPSKNSKGAIVGAVVRSVNDAMGYTPKSKQSNGLFLAVWTATMVIPIMAVSGSTSTVASRGFLSEELQAKYTIISWALYALPFIIPMMILMAIFVILYWVFKENLGNIPDYASCLLVLSIFWFTGCLDAKTFRCDVSWENIIFIGSCISLGTILPYVGITDWIVEVVSPYTNMAFSNPVLTIVILVIMMFVVRFLLLSEGSFISIMCALLYPLATTAGVNPWVIAIIMNLMVSEFFFPYQSSAFLSGYYSFGDDAFDSKATSFYWVVFTIIGTISLLIASVVWQMMGIWWL